MAYFDNNSTTKPGAEVREAYDQALREKVGETRPLLAGRELPFGSGLIGRGKASPAYWRLIRKALLLLPDRLRQITLFCSCRPLFRTKCPGLGFLHRHPSVLAPADHWFSKRVQTFPVEPTGVIDLERISALLDGDSEFGLFR